MANNGTGDNTSYSNTTATAPTPPTLFSSQYQYPSSSSSQYNNWLLPSTNSGPTYFPPNPPLLQPFSSSSAVGHYNHGLFSTPSSSTATLLPTPPTPYPLSSPWTSSTPTPLAPPSGGGWASGLSNVDKTIARVASGQAGVFQAAPHPPAAAAVATTTWSSPTWPLPAPAPPPPVPQAKGRRGVKRARKTSRTLAPPPSPPPAPAPLLLPSYRSGSSYSAPVTVAAVVKTYQMSHLPASPEGWDEAIDSARQALAPYLRIRVPPDSDEFQVISDLMADGQAVTGVERVVNADLWRKFTTARKELLTSKTTDLELCTKLGLSEKEVMQVAHIAVNFDVHRDMPPYSDNMALLWHGTRGNLDVVLSQGLDERLGNSGLLGRGIYFTDDPLKSSSYDSHGVLLLCAVFLGDCQGVAVGNSSFVREPEKGAGQKRNGKDLFFDSIVGRPTGAANEFVIYNRAQCCPFYAVSYQRSSSKALGNPYGGQESLRRKTLYSATRAQLPPFAWTAAKSQATPPDQWPFFAGTIFELMSPTPEPTPPPPTPSHPEGSEEDVAEKIARLCDMGFCDVVNNRLLLARFGFNMERTVDFLLAPPPSPPPTVDLTRSPSAATGTAQSTVTVEMGVGSSSGAATGIGSGSGTTPVTSSADSSGGDVGEELDLDDLWGSCSWKPGELSDGGMESTNLEDLNPTVALLLNQPPEEEEDCTICYEKYSAEPGNWTILPCKHKICSACAANLEQSGTTMSGTGMRFLKCPFCGGGCGGEIGSCPNGNMNVSRMSQSCPGYEGYGTHVIHYSVSHPKYHLSRTAYVPACPEGDRVLGLLRVAWDRRLCFSIGTSITTGQKDVLVWNLHHKTAISGGAYGFPDPTYLTRVLDELKQYDIQ